MVGKLVRLGEILHHRVVRRELVLRQSQHTDDAVHRGSYLVRHTREERCFGLALLLYLGELFLVTLDLSAQCSRPAEAQQVVHAVRAAADSHLHPLAVLHTEHGGHRLFAVPHPVLFPDRNALALVLERSIEHHNVLLHLLERYIQQTLHIAGDADRHQVALAHHKANGIGLSIHIVQQNIVRPAQRTALRLCEPGPRRSAQQQRTERKFGAARRHQRKMLSHRFE